MLEQEKLIDNVVDYLDRVQPELVHYHELCSSCAFSHDFVIVADWNKLPEKLQDFCERELDAHIAYEDEVCTCENCGRAFWTQAMHAFDEGSYLVLPELGAVFCRDCCESDESAIQEVIDYATDNANCVLPSWFKSSLNNGEWMQEGELFNEDGKEEQYQTGMHRGMNDSPQEQAKRIERTHGLPYVFICSETSQFYASWEIWVKNPFPQDSFMQPVVEYGEWLVADGCEAVPHGILSIVGYAQENGLDIEEVAEVEGYGARMSAPGYMDATEWMVYDSYTEAVEGLIEMHGGE